VLQTQVLSALPFSALSPNPFYSRAIPARIDPRTAELPNQT